MIQAKVLTIPRAGAGRGRAGGEAALFGSRLKALIILCCYGRVFRGVALARLPTVCSSSIDLNVLLRPKGERPSAWGVVI